MAPRPATAAPETDYWLQCEPMAPVAGRPPNIGEKDVGQSPGRSAQHWDCCRSLLNAVPKPRPTHEGLDGSEAWATVLIKRPVRGRPWTRARMPMRFYRKNEAGPLGIPPKKARAHQFSNRQLDAGTRPRSRPAMAMISAPGIPGWRIGRGTAAWFATRWPQPGTTWQTEE